MRGGLPGARRIHITAQRGAAQHSAAVQQPGRTLAHHSTHLPSTIVYACQSSALHAVHTPASVHAAHPSLHAWHVPAGGSAAAGGQAGCAGTLGRRGSRAQRTAAAAHGWAAAPQPCLTICQPHIARVARAAGAVGLGAGGVAAIRRKLAGSIYFCVALDVVALDAAHSGGEQGQSLQSSVGQLGAAPAAPQRSPAPASRGAPRAVGAAAVLRIARTHVGVAPPARGQGEGGGQGDGGCSCEQARRRPKQRWRLPRLAGLAHRQVPLGAR